MKMAAVDAEPQVFRDVVDGNGGGDHLELEDGLIKPEVDVVGLLGEDD